MFRAASTFAFFLTVGAFLRAQQPPDLRLPETAAPTSYKADLTLDPAQDTFTGKIDIQLKINQPTDILWLNQSKLHLTSSVLHSGSNDIPVTTVDGGSDFVGLKFPSTVPAGSASLSISYSGEIRSRDSSGAFRMLDNGNKYIFSQFEPIDARDVFPCFDEPSYKVPWQLSLTVPSADTAISNTAIEKKVENGAQTTYVFGQTKPLPSYLIAFGVGPFDYVDAGKAGRNHIPVRIVTPKGHAEEAKYAAEVTATIITRLEEYFGIAFPYPKSDQVAIPQTYGFGAMENAGMVTYGQTIILAKPSVDTIARQREYASVAAHELAHQWFGDLVTTAWWNDIWLNEAFATWMEQKLIREWKPEWHTNLSDVDSRLFAQGQDSILSARKIRQEIVKKDDISNAFDGITYQKGAAVIAMFENMVGPSDFRKGVKSYLEQYAFKNANAPEFLDSISTASHKDVTKSFSTFLNQAGVPLVSMALDCKPGAAPVLQLKEQRFVPLGVTSPAPQTWQIPVCIRFGEGASGSSACELVTQPEQTWTLKTSSCPAWVEGNDKAIGYYRIDYQGGLLAKLTEGDVQARLSSAERIDLMGNTQALSSAGKISASDSLALVNVFSSDPVSQVVEGALELAVVPAAHQVPEDLMPNFRRFLQKNFQEHADQVGWTIKPGEDPDVTLLRPRLVGVMATLGGDQSLAAEAHTLAEQWIQNHSSLNPNLVSTVLNSAAYNGDKILFEKLADNLQVTKDLQERAKIIAALSRFRDPSALEAGFDSLLNGRVPFIEGPSLLFAGQGRPATRQLAFEFVKAHFDEILAKAPVGGGFDFGSALPNVGASYCDVESEQQLKDYFDPRADKLLGARHTLNQVVERINTCIAQKAEQSPSVSAFLQKY